jgi:hypothetical protein
VHYASAIADPGYRDPFGRKIALKILGDAKGNTAFDDMPLPGPFHMFAKAAAPLLEGWHRLRDIGDF